MKTNTKDVMFLLFYSPLFFIKLLTFDASTNILKITAIACFSVFLLYMLLVEKYRQKEFYIWLIGGIFLSVLVVTCGKEGALFSFMTMIMMRYTHRTRNRSILFYLGIFGVLLCLYMTKDTREAIRYVDGVWVSMTKRSNIAFISFFAVINLYFLTYQNVKKKALLIIGVLAYLIYKYTGCRTGIYCAVILYIMIILYKSPKIRKSKIIKIAVLSSPTICMIGSIIMVYAYNAGSKWAVLINNIIQGRLRLGSLFMKNYDPKLFGQKLTEDFSNSNFMVLDSAYLDMFLCYGLIFSAAWIIFTTIVINWLYKKKNYIGVAVLISYSIFGITETFLPNCFLNPSLLLYGDYIIDKLKLGVDQSKPIYIFRHRLSNRGIKEI